MAPQLVTAPLRASVCILFKATLTSSWVHTQALIWMHRALGCVSVPAAYPHPYHYTSSPAHLPLAHPHKHKCTPLSLFPNQAFPALPPPSPDVLRFLPRVPSKPDLRIWVQFLLGVKPHQIHSQRWGEQVFLRTALGWLVMFRTSSIYTHGLSVRCMSSVVLC